MRSGRAKAFIPGRNECAHGVANPCGNLLSISMPSIGKCWVRLTVVLYLLVMLDRLLQLYA